MALYLKQIGPVYAGCRNFDQDLSRPGIWHQNFIEVHFAGPAAVLSIAIAAIVRGIVMVRAFLLCTGFVAKIRALSDGKESERQSGFFDFRTFRVATWPEETWNKGTR